MSPTRNSKNSRRQHQGPTIADVAEEAGVSPMTVSRVINGEDRVRIKTRKRVEDAIAKLQYTPNLSARQLAGAQPIHVGLIYDNPSSAYLSEFLVGALEQTSQLNVQLTVEKSENPQGAMATAEAMVARGVDGLLLPPPLSDSSLVLAYLETLAIPTVVAASPHTGMNVSAVSINDEQAAYEMTRHIIELGHRRIGFIAGNPNQSATDLRLTGYQKALRDFKLTVNPQLIAQGQFSYRTGLEAATKLLSLASPPTAIFASNDDMAAATVAVAHRLGLNVPQQLTVCGFDDSLMATTIWPELTTIHQPIIEMSRTAVKLLVEKIRAARNDQEPESEHLVLDFTFMKRESDAPLSFE